MTGVQTCALPIWLLAVDDNRLILRVIRDFFLPMGWEVTTAENVALARSALGGAAPDVIVSDILMPDVDGWAFFEDVRKRKATVILRGIRTVADFESEFQMALTNRLLAPDLETIFVMASQEYSFLSSRLIKETGSLGGDLSHFVPPGVEKRLKKKFRKR